MALAGTFDITVPCYNGHLVLGTQVTVISRGDCIVSSSRGIALGNIAKSAQQIHCTRFPANF
jgi:hypothetical protein